MRFRTKRPQGFLKIHHMCEKQQLAVGLEERLIHSNKPSNQVADSRSHFSRKKQKDTP